MVQILPHALLALALLLASVGLVDAQDELSLLQRAKEQAPTFASLASATLDDERAGPYTVLAPMDNALETLPDKYLTPEWSDYLEAVLAYHVLEGEFSTTDLALNNRFLSLLPGDVVTVTRNNNGNTMFNGNAQVVTGNQAATNGILHTIDNVLLPPNADMSLLDHLTASPEFSIFLGYITRFNLTSVLDEEGPLTVLIPSNNAFQAVPSAILRQFDDEALMHIISHHFLPGSIAFAYPLGNKESAFKTYETMQGTTSLDFFGGGVVDAAGFDGLGHDVMASNGIWHSIDSVLLPVIDTEVETLVDAIASQDRLARFIIAIRSAGIEATVNGPEALTIFAPVNEAFDSLPFKLYQDEWQLHLAAVLAYHMVPDEAIPTTFVMTGLQLPTLEGNNITITQTTPRLQLNSNNVQVITPNIPTGITTTSAIHMVDQLLLPPFISTDMAQAISADSDLSELARAMSDDGALFTLGLEGPFTLLAPTNSAFAKGPVAIVLQSMTPEDRLEVFKYHVIPGLIKAEDMVMGARFITLQGTLVMCTGDSPAKINSGTFVQTDVLANNGIIHHIDTVLFPFLTNDSAVTEAPAIAPSTSVGAPSAPTITAATENIMELVAKTNELSSLEIALSNSVVEATLLKAGPFTLFAPTNAAWSNGNDFDSLVNRQQILMMIYHVVPGIFELEDLTPGLELDSFDGHTLRIFEAGMINDAIILSSMSASNGVIHIIDTILDPPNGSSELTAQPATPPAGQPAAQTTPRPSRRPTKAPSASPNAASTTRTPEITTPTKAPQPECDAEMIKFAGNTCCPITDESFKAFCEALFYQEPEPTMQPITQPTPRPSFRPTKTPSASPAVAIVTRAPEVKTTTSPSVPPTSKAPITQSPVTLPPMQAPIETAPTAGSHPECDAEMIKFAGNTCCPIINDSYKAFCEALFYREPEPTAQPVTRPTAQPVFQTTPRPSLRPTKTPSASPVVAIVPTSKAPISFPPTSAPVTLPTTQAPVETAPTAAPQPDCDAEVLKYAGGVCCPILNDSYKTFCESLFNRVESEIP